MKERLHTDYNIDDKMDGKMDEGSKEDEVSIPKTIYDIEKEVFKDLVESSSSGHTIELLEKSPGLYTHSIKKGDTLFILLHTNEEQTDQLITDAEIEKLKLLQEGVKKVRVLGHHPIEYYKGDKKKTRDEFKQSVFRIKREVFPELTGDDFCYICADEHYYCKSSIVNPSNTSDSFNQYIVGTGGTKLDPIPNGTNTDEHIEEIKREYGYLLLQKDGTFKFMSIDDTSTGDTSTIKDSGSSKKRKKSKQKRRKKSKQKRRKKQKKKTTKKQKKKTKKYPR